MTRLGWAPVVAGVLLALSAPPHNLWFLAPVGLAVLYRCLEDRPLRPQAWWERAWQPHPRRQRALHRHPWRRGWRQHPWQQRAWRGWLGAFTMFVITLSWARQFQVVGWLLLAGFQALFFALAAVAVPGEGRGRATAFVGALTLAEALRTHWPWGGVPLGGFTLGQAHGPLAPAVSVVGELGLVAVLACLGVAVSELLRSGRPRPTIGPSIEPFRPATPNRRATPTTANRQTTTANRRTTGWVALFTALAIVGAGRHVHTTASGSLRVAAVQGGGPQATPRSAQQPAQVFAAQWNATGQLHSPVDLIVWPENTIEINRPIATSAAAGAMADLASAHHATVVAGVVEITPHHRFHNLAVAWAPNGAIVGSYEKQIPVPFGEWVPGRPVLRHLIGLSAVPYDAFVGHDSPVLTVGSPVGNHQVGVAISYETLFARKARAAVRAGAEVLLVPTNAASYRSTTVAKQETEAARLRALETGRWVVQSAPTGISAIIDTHGHVQQQTAIGVQQTLEATIATSRTITPYARWGDWPVLIAAIVALVRSASRNGRLARGRADLRGEQRESY